MKELLNRETVSNVGKIAFAVAVGAYAYLYVSPESKKGKS